MFDLGEGDRGCLSRPSGLALTRTLALVHALRGEEFADAAVAHRALQRQQVRGVVEAVPAEEMMPGESVVTVDRGR
ncbi:hypothetical protein GCM10011608_41240 [Micromonospora sonchi]|uniref:Uncharacterized protein n=1 Tax=Micromonospora sonchi TaxID=1763543 RepID=A0A917X1V6_9ACTN|nr:hypothetical protein GCM10011608_41240 [Micromonospora sonchi]